MVLRLPFFRLSYSGDSAAATDTHRHALPAKSASTRDTMTLPSEPRFSTEPCSQAKVVRLVYRPPTATLRIRITQRSPMWRPAAS